MKSIRLISLCILLASQFALAQHLAAPRRSTHRHLTPDQTQQASPEQVLYRFQGGNDGIYPVGNLASDSSGNLYGVTEYGGLTNKGTFYELSPNGSGGWTEAVLYSFQGGSDGEYPSAGLIFDTAGNLYGTTRLGGEGNPSNCGSTGCGTVFELSPNGSGGWAESVLYSLEGGSTDGIEPAGLTFDKNGNMYGVIQYGGVGCPDIGCGSIFELSPNPGGSGWTEKILHQFQGTSDGSLPQPILTFDASGNLYGSAAYGGSFGVGVVFELSPNGGGGWSESTVHAFQGNNDGSVPNGGLIFDPSGNLYGTTQSGPNSNQGQCGGQVSPPGCGTVFKLSPDGAGGWVESVPFVFPNGSGGALPQAGLVMDGFGNFYGTTVGGGNSLFTPCPGSGWPGCGTAFELSPAGGTLTETPLYIFQGASDGSGPVSALLFGQAGQLYAMAGGGSGNPCGGVGCGVVFAVTVGPLASLTPGTVGLGNQTISFASTAQSITLTNTGNKPMTISSIQITGANAAEFSQQNNCPATLAVNASCTIGVTFLPTILGSASAALTITNNASGSPQNIPLTGTGVIDVTFSPSTVIFPSQYVGTAGLPQAVTLTNNTNSTIAIKTVTASPGAFAAPDTCPDTLPPGGYCSVGVFFDPTASGPITGVLTVTDTAPTGQQTVALTGTGQDFSMIAGSSPSASVMPGETAQYTVSVAPAGGFSQTVTLTCAGAPLDSSCSISPSSVKLNGSAPVPVTISVSTAGNSAATTYPGFTRASMLAIWLAFAGLPGVVLLGSKKRGSDKSGSERRKTRAMFCAIVLLCLISGIVTWTACGGGGMGSNSNSGGATTPAGNYNLTVVGTFSSGSANLVHSAKLTLVVQ